jgi:transcriptional regulator with XRE-family HTH domain
MLRVMTTHVADHVQNGNGAAGLPHDIPLGVPPHDIPLGALLRDWRRKRRMSQADLALDADISAKHLSFIETGRARPSRQMLLHLAGRLDVPLRERNALLEAGGFAPAYEESAFDDPALEVLRHGMEVVLSAYNPNPAMVIDRRWTMLSANRSLPRLVAGVEPMLLRAPVNLLRLALHPAGLAPRIINLAEWRAAMILRLRRQIEDSSDGVLHDLLEEIRDYPAPSEKPGGGQCARDVAVPFRLATIDGEMSFFNTRTTISMPVDITVSELSIEAFLSADGQTAALLQQASQFGARHEPAARELEPAFG